MTTYVTLPGLAAAKRKLEQKKTAGNRVGHLSPPVGLKFIRFTGHWGTKTQSFQVAPAPDAGPLVTGGWPIINVIPRPQRISLTVPVGYDPVTLDIPVLFDCWTSPTRFSDAQDIEESIAKLEWMYGRGSYGGGTAGGAVGVGPPPVIQIATVNNAGVTIPLLSSNYQRTIAGKTSTVTSGLLNNGGAPNYEITAISWDANPLRVPAGQPFGGCRMRQAATISVQEIVSDPYVTTPGTAAKVVTSNYTIKTGDTFASIARKQLGGNTPQTAVFVVALVMMLNNANVRGVVRSVSAPQKAGTVIKITT